MPDGRDGTILSRGIFRKRRPATHWDIADCNRCKNCGNKLSGNYCSHCGQKAYTKRLRFGSSIRSFFAGFFNVERGFLSTIRMLFTRPGYLARDYIDGKRTARTNPFTLLFVLATVYGILRTASTLYLTGELPPTGIEEDIIEELGDSSLSTILGYIVEKLANSTVILSLAMLPLYTLSIKILFRRRNRGRYNYTELMYMGGYLACQRVLVDLAFLPYKWVNHGDDGTYWTWIMALYIILTTYTLRQFFAVRWVKSVWKTLMVFLLSFFLIIVAIALASLLVAGIFYLFWPEQSRVKLFGTDGMEDAEIRVDSSRIDAVRVNPDSLPVFPDSTGTPASDIMPY